MDRFCFADAEGGYHEKRLLHDLLDPYNILERPVVNESDPLQLSFGLTLMQIIDVVRKGGDFISGGNYIHSLRVPHSAASF